MNKEIRIIFKKVVVKRMSQVFSKYDVNLIDQEPDNDEQLLVLTDWTGYVILDKIDIFKYTQGFDILNADDPFGFNDYVANLCDVLLMKADKINFFTEDRNPL